MQADLSPAQVSNLESVSTEQLKRDLADCLSLSVASIVKAGMVWAELERRGEDLRDLKRRLPHYLPRIAAGTLAAEAVVAFASRPNLLKAMNGLPLDRQRDIADGEFINLVVPGDDGYAVRAVPAAVLTQAQVRQVFGDGQVREPDEQEAILDEVKRPRPRVVTADPASPKKFRVRADAQTQTLRVGNAAVTPAEVCSALAELAGPLELIGVSVQDTETATVRLTVKEKAKLKAAEHRRGLPEWHLIREAIHAAGLI